MSWPSFSWRTKCMMNLRMRMTAYFVGNSSLAHWHKLPIAADLLNRAMLWHSKKQFITHTHKLKKMMQQNTNWKNRHFYAFSLFIHLFLSKFWLRGFGFAFLFFFVAHLAHLSMEDGGDFVGSPIKATANERTNENEKKINTYWFH